MISKINLIKNKLTDKDFLKELAKFGTTGGLSFILHLIIFNILFIHLFDQQHSLVAKAIAVIIATLFSWTMNRNWTFSKTKNDNKRKEGIGFFIVNGIGLIIEAIPLWITVYLVGVTSIFVINFMGNIVGTGMGTIFRYLVYKKVIFNNASENDEAKKEEAS